MHLVILQAWISHDDFPAEQVPDRYRARNLSDARATHTIFEREIQLPFVPYPDLIVWVGKGNLADDEVRIAQVIYDMVAKRFLCEVNARITKGATFEQVAMEYLQSGWTW